MLRKDKKILVVMLFALTLVLPEELMRMHRLVDRRRETGKSGRVL